MKRLILLIFTILLSGTFLAENSKAKETTILIPFDDLTKPDKTLKGHSDAVSSVSFSPDARLLASGSEDYTVILWDTSSIKLTSTPIGDSIKVIEAKRNEKINGLYTPKGEFETTAEYNKRMNTAKAEEGRIRKEYDDLIMEAKDRVEKEIEEIKAKLYPYTLSVSLGAYDADREGFSASILGNNVFIPISREKAIKISRQKAQVNIQGMARYYDSKNAELTNAYLVDETTNEKFAFGKHTVPMMVASQQKSPPDLRILSIELIEPSGNKILDAGETGKIRVGVKNIGMGAGFGVSLSLTSEGLLPKGMSFNEKTYIGSINPDEEKTLNIALNALEDIQTADVNLKAIALEGSGFDSKPLVLSFKTKELIPPLLQIARIDIEDAEGRRIITKGKEANITLVVQNAGLGIARGVIANIQTGSSEIKLFSESKANIGELNPGESKKAVFTIAVTQRYSGLKTLPISFSINEKRAQFSIKPDIKLALNEEAPEIRVVKVEAVETPAIKVSALDDVNEIPSLALEEKVMGVNDIAVVIGIERYQNLQKSDYSYDDAKLMKEYLKALGFAERNIQYLTDDKATHTGIKKIMESWLPNVAKPESKVFIYYSGHGAPEPNTGDAYLVPYDGDPNYLSDTGYPLKRLYDNLGKLQVKEAVVVLDSCFSGSGGRSVLAKGARPIVIMTEGMVLSENMAVLTSTQGSQISTSNPERGHGVFTYYFLKALKEGRKALSEIYEYIKPLVEDEARRQNVQQSPSISPELENLRGRFRLRR